MTSFGVSTDFLYVEGTYNLANYIEYYRMGPLTLSPDKPCQFLQICVMDYQGSMECHLQITRQNFATSLKPLKVLYN